MQKLLQQTALTLALGFATAQSVADMGDMHHHDMSGMASSMQDMAGMENMPGMAAERPAPVAGPVYPPPTPAERAAAFPDLGGMTMREHMNDNDLYHQVLLDRLENQTRDGESALSWEGRAWLGYDFNKLWLRSEGERRAGRSEELQTEAYWGHAISPWWESMVGVRQDGGPGPSRTWAALGVQGRTPYFVRMAATVFLGDGSRSALRVEVEDEWLLTQRLILQPALELNAYDRADPERAVGAGLSDSRLGLRLRYELRREFAPYVGLEWRWVRGAGQAEELQNGPRLVAGLRLWF